MEIARAAWARASKAEAVEVGAETVATVAMVADTEVPKVVEERAAVREAAAVETAGWMAAVARAEGGAGGAVGVGGGGAAGGAGGGAGAAKKKKKRGWRWILNPGTTWRFASSGPTPPLSSAHLWDARAC